MYHCKDCGKDFESPQKCKENDTELLTISRTYYVCPNCESSNIDEKIIKYCRCCGRSIGFKNSDYCSLACRRRGEKIFENERRKNLHIK